LGLVDLKDNLEGFLHVKPMIKAQSNIFERSTFRIIASLWLIIKQFGKMRPLMAFCFMGFNFFFGQFSGLWLIQNMFSRKIRSGPNTNSIHSMELK